jgi:hypothetical protein
MFIEGICKNLNISYGLQKLAFCGIRLSVDSMKLLNETIIKNKVLKELIINYCLLDITMLEAIMPALCQNRCLETINIACNGLNDKASYLIAKIISS